MPLVTLTKRGYADEARELAGQLKCCPKGDEWDNRFAMNDLGRLDLYTEPGLMRQIDSLRGRNREPVCFDSRACRVSGDSNGKIEIQGDSRKILSGNFIDSIQHYFQRRVSLEVSDGSGVIESSSPVLSSHFLRVLLSDLTYLSALDQVQVTTSQNVLGCIEDRKREIILTDDAVKNLLGYNFSHEQIIETLQRFGYTVSGEVAGGLRVEIPFHRVDIASESDVIEDVMLCFLQSFKGNFPVQVHNPEGFDCALLQKQMNRAKLVDGLVAFGFKEVKTPVLRKAPSNRDYKLREDILPSFLAYEQKRQHIAQPHYVFELGPVRTGNKLSNHLGLGVVGNNVDFNNLFSIVHHLVASVTGRIVTLKSIESGKYEKGRAFVILLSDGRLIGEIGVVSTGKMPGVRLRHQCMYAELDLPAFI
ncbi:MAG: hypothetical protein WC897_05805 [Candidatus Gracilibacteria bacterium]